MVCYAQVSPHTAALAPTCTSGYSGERQRAEALQSAAGRQVALAPAGLGVQFGPLSASYMMPVNVCGLKTHLRHSFIQEGVGMGVERMTVSL